MRIRTLCAHGVMHFIFTGIEIERKALDQPDN